LKQLPRAGKPGETNLASFHRWFAQWDDAFAQLRQAGQLPNARLPGEYINSASLPVLNFVQIRLLAQVLVSRAKIHLLLGDLAEAFQDLEAILVVMRGLDAPPGSLVSVMIEVAVAGIYIDVVEEGLRHDLWSEVELKKLAPRLATMNFLSPLQAAMRAGRAHLCDLLSALAQRDKTPSQKESLREIISLSLGKKVTPMGILARVSPSGWLHRGQSQYALLMQEYIDAIEPASQRIDLKKIQNAISTVKSLNGTWTPHMALVRTITPDLAPALLTLARTQTRARQAALACAIHQFHSAEKRYPHNLAELVPKFIAAIPTDTFQADPIAYRVTQNGWELSSKGIDPRNGTSVTIVWNSP
jgi:hypothetical protein